MKDEKLQVVKLKSIKLDKSVYPRAKVDWVTKSRYYNAMKSKAEFPPICVAKAKFRGYILIDGAHRLEAMKDIGETHCQAEVLDGLSKKELYLEAVRRNIGHGRQFSTQEVSQIVITMKDWNMSSQEIAELIRIPADKLSAFIAKRMVRVGNNDVAIKAPLCNLAGTEQDYDFEANESRISGSSQIQVMDTLISMLENDWINMESAIVRARINKIYKLISALKIVEEPIEA